MKWTCVFLFWFWTLSSQCDNGDPVGIMDSIIKTILESLRPSLANLYVTEQNFETGPQEIGNFKGNIREVTVEGLDKFVVKILKTFLLDINNLTIVEENFSAKGFYKINGTLAFPMGKNDIHLYGDGDFRAKFNNFTISLKMKIRLENDVKVVKDFDIFVGLEKMQVYFNNLMGGGDLERVFNSFINDVGITVVNYYKQPILNVIKPQIIDIINQLLNKNMIEEINCEELYGSLDFFKVLSSLD